MKKLKLEKLNLKIKKSEAFTLVEILVYVAVLVVIISVIFSFFLWASYSSNKTKASKEVLNSSRRAMEIMSFEIRGAKSIYIPTSDMTQLSLKTGRYLPEGENSSYIDFYLCDGRLCLKKETQNPVALTSDKVEITNLEFALISATSTAPSVQISLEIDYKNPQDRMEYQASINTTSTVSLRNY